MFKGNEYTFNGVCVCVCVWGGGGGGQLFHNLIVLVPFRKGVYYKRKPFAQCFFPLE